MSEIAYNAQPCNYLLGNIATLLFYEPSSRTRGSFDAATKQLGGQTIVVENPQQFSSVAKGESFGDTIKTFEAYCDIIVLRHPEVGSALKAARAAQFVPIINAGDGIGEHPTQALLDLYTIYEKIGTLSGIKGLFVGDIKNGRTVHSLLKGLSLYKNNTVYLLSPEQLKLQRPLFEQLTGSGLFSVLRAIEGTTYGDCMICGMKLKKSTLTPGDRCTKTCWRSCGEASSP